MRTWNSSLWHLRRSWIYNTYGPERDAYSTKATCSICLRRETILGQQWACPEVVTCTNVGKLFCEEIFEERYVICARLAENTGGSSGWTLPMQVHATWSWGWTSFDVSGDEYSASHMLCPETSDEERKRYVHNEGSSWNPENWLEMILETSFLIRLEDF